MLFFALYLAAEVVGIVAASVIYVCLLGGRIGGPERYVRVNAALQRKWTSAIFSGAFRVFGMTLHVEGAEQVVPGPLIVLVRHSSTADTLLTAAVVGNPHRLLLRYVVKQELLWDPCIDIVGARLPNAFVDRDAPKSEAKRAAVAALGEGLDAESGALIYPEGTRFSPSKLERGLERLRERGSTSLLERAEGFRHVLPPRVGGVLTLLDQAPSCDVLFVEHFGFERVKTFADFWNGGLVGRAIHVRLRRIASSDIPTSARAEWLYEQWTIVDEWIHAGIAAHEPGPPGPASNLGAVGRDPFEG